MIARRAKLPRRSRSWRHRCDRVLSQKGAPSHRLDRALPRICFVAPLRFELIWTDAARHLAAPTPNDATYLTCECARERAIGTYERAAARSRRCTRGRASVSRSRADPVRALGPPTGRGDRFSTMRPHASGSRAGTCPRAASRRPLGLAFRSCWRTFTHFLPWIEAADTVRHGRLQQAWTGLRRLRR